MEKHITDIKKVKQLQWKKQKLEARIARAMRTRIKILLLEKGIKQSELAQALKVSRPTICKTIAGKSFSIRVEEEIARRIGRSRKSLFGR